MDTTASLAFAGALAPLLIAAVTRAGWSATAKRWVAIAVSATLTGLVWALTRYPESVSAILGELGGVIAAAQVVYAALKPTGLLDRIEERTE
nr:MAG TPA: hypothetical protein [Caudoviricetes sp.]